MYIRLSLQKGLKTQASRPLSYFPDTRLLITMTK